MTTDTISRQAAIDAIKHNQDIYSNNFGGDAIDKYTVAIIANDIESLINLPPAERHGRWIRTGEDGYCSVCKCDMPMFRNDWEWEYTETPYCPNCGARMEE